jgi:DNA-binding NarL/FixJ family response regulator
LKQTRILIVAMPRMLHEIVETTLSSQPDMTVTGPVRRKESVAAAARRVRADLVILRESQEGAAATPWQVLNQKPRLKVLAISGDGHRVTRYELRPHQVVIHEISPEHLVDAVRAAMAN